MCDERRVGARNLREACENRAPILRERAALSRRRARSSAVDVAAAVARAKESNAPSKFFFRVCDGQLRAAASRPVGGAARSFVRSLTRILPGSEAHASSVRARCAFSRWRRSLSSPVDGPIKVESGARLARNAAGGGDERRGDDGGGTERERFFTSCKIARRH